MIRNIFRAQVLLLALLVSCSSSNPVGDDGSAASGRTVRGPSQSKVLLESGQEKMKQGKYEDAIKDFRSIAYFERGRETQYFANALVQEALCEEALSRDERVVALLQDALARKNLLSQDVGEVEVPARLAAAYARLGNEEEATLYFNNSERALKKLRSSDEPTPQWLAKIYYNMGFLSVRKITLQNFEKVMKAMQTSQAYLYRALEMNDADWSAKSEKIIMDLYSEALTVIESTPLEKEEDRLVAQRMRQEKMQTMAIQLEASADALVASVLPGRAKSNEYTNRMHTFIDKVKTQTTQIRTARPIGEELTDDAKSREAIKRDVKLVDPEKAK